MSRRRLSTAGRGATQQWATAVAVHLLLTLVWTWPAALQVDTRVAAGSGDQYVYMWNFWWFRHALLELGVSPYTTHLLYHPTGTPLGFHDMIYFWSVLSIPLQAVLDLPTILNLFALSSVPLTGLALYHLCREVTGRHSAALAGSLLLPYGPLFIRHLRVVHFHYLSAFFVPLFLLELWRYAREPRLRHLLKAGVYLSLSCLMNYYYAAALGSIFVGFFLYRFAKARSGGGRRATWRTQAGHLAAFGAVVGLLSSPAVVPTAVQLASGDFSAKITQRDHLYLESNSADLVSYFVPDYMLARSRLWDLTDATSRIADSLRDALAGGDLEKSVFPGWPCWIAIAVVLAHGPLRARYWPWALLSLGALVVTLGPTLWIGGVPHLRGLLPMSLLSELPVLGNLRGLSRFALLIPIGGGVALAGILAHLARRSDTKAYQYALVLSIAITLSFSLPHPARYESSDAFLSAFYEQMALEPGDHAVLNVPASFAGAKGGAFLYEYAQTVHGKPIVSGYVAREPDFVHETYERWPFLDAVRARPYERDGRLRLGAGALASAAETLRALRIRYVIVHKSLLEAPEWLRVNGWLASALGRAIYEDQWLRVYRSPHEGYQE